MEFIRQYKNEICFLAVLLIIILLISCYLYFGLHVKDEDIQDNGDNVDISDVNNVEAVESRLDYKMKISQSYLLTYTTNKSGIWYMSSAYVSKIKLDGTLTYITLTNEDKTHSLVAEISSSKVTIKKGELINFVGTIDLETGNIELAKISKDTINYNNVTKMEFSKLVDNINTVKNNIFVINGYMITDGSKYKLFESKSAYKKDSSVGKYFTIEWKDDFKLTGNSNVTLECKVNGTYKLSECNLI